MVEIVVRGGQIITGTKIESADLYIANGLMNFADAGSGKDYQTNHTIDAKDCFISTGLFDLQVNGCPECNLWQDPNANQFVQLCDLLLKAGVTAFMPTLITDDLEHLKKNISFLESMGLGESEKEQQNSPSALICKPGIHLEGPFLSPERPGVHPKEYLLPLLTEQLEELVRPSVKLMTLAPELDNGQKAVELLRKKHINLSLGHSNATFDQANQAFDWGIGMVTHIFNALPPIHQRRPGAIIAALQAKDVYCCVIGDGLHVDPHMVKLLVDVKGVDKVILVTDMASVGTTGGGLVGASITLSDAVRNIVKWGIATFPEAVKMATYNPAKAMHLDHSLGQISPGRRADLVIWDKKTLAIKHVIASGQVVF